MWHAGAILARRFGIRARPALAFALFALYRAVISAGLALDHVFFPGIRKVRIDRPVFIIGNPRSGTTLVHRFLAGHGIGAAFQLWEMLVPSLTLRRLLRPWIGTLERLDPGRFHLGAVHETSLTAVETDDLLVFLRFLDGVFYYTYFLAWDEDPHREYLDPGRRPARLAPRHLRWLRACYRRQLYRGDNPRVLGKLFSVCLCPGQLLQVFPDARLVYLVRDPVQAIPSSLSLVSGVVGRVSGGRPLPAVAGQALVTNLVQAARALYTGFLRDLRDGRIPSGSLMVVRYDDLMQRFDAVMTQLLDFAGHPADARLVADIARQAAAQRERRSGHVYSLEQYGLDGPALRRDFGFVYEAFGLDPGAPTGGDPDTTPAPGYSS